MRPSLLYGVAAVAAVGAAVAVLFMNMLSRSQPELASFLTAVPVTTILLMFLLLAARDSLPRMRACLRGSVLFSLSALIFVTLWWVTLDVAVALLGQRAGALVALLGASCVWALCAGTVAVGAI